MAARGVAPGEPLVRVPAELGLSDAWDPARDGPDLYPGAPWGVRLAAKLLRERAEGQGGARAPWLAVLPESVPSAYFFEWEETREIQYAPLLADLDRYGLLVQDSLRSAGGAGSSAVGGASKEEWEWAMALVHSRSFAVLTSAPEVGGGGEGVVESVDGRVLMRLMVPLVDMFNHSGDLGFYTRDAAAPGPSAGAVWEAVESPGGVLELEVRGSPPPAEDLWGEEPGVSEFFMPDDNSAGEGGGAAMIEAEGESSQGFPPVDVVPTGDEIFFSYGDRPNDDFLLHYGFVPLHNPHDSVELFEGLPEALEWYTGRFLSDLGPGEVAQRRVQAEAAAEAADTAAEVGEEAAVRALRELQRVGEPGPARDPMSLLLGGRLDPRLTPVFAAMAGAELGKNLSIDIGGGAGDGEVVLDTAIDASDLLQADAAVVERCLELLNVFPTTLVEDLELLAGLPSVEQAHFSELLRHFSDGSGRPQPEGVGPGGVPWTENLYKAVAFRCHKKLVLHDAVERLGPPE